MKDDVSGESAAINVRAPSVAETPQGEEQCAMCGQRMRGQLTQNRIKGVWYYVHSKCAYRFTKGFYAGGVR